MGTKDRDKKDRCFHFWSKSKLKEKPQREETLQEVQNRRDAVRDTKETKPCTDKRFYKEILQET